MSTLPVFLLELILDSTKRFFLLSLQTIKSLWKEISDWRSCLAVLIIKNIWLASIKVFPYPVHMTCADDRYLTRFTILILPRSSTRRKASYHSSPEMHYFSIERKLPPLYCRIIILDWGCTSPLYQTVFWLEQSALQDSLKCGGKTVHYIILLDMLTFRGSLACNDEIFVSSVRRWQFRL